MIERARAHGIFTAVFRDRHGRVIWRDTFPNLVATQGKNVMLDAALSGAAYTVVGPYMGLISSVSFVAIAAGDTMASHGGWLEAGNANLPTYSGSRKTCAWLPATGGAKALSASLTFNITADGTLKGGFLTYGTGAVATVDATTGSLYSAGLFTGGDLAVTNGGAVTVTYTTSL